MTDWVGKAGDLKWGMGKNHNQGHGASKKCLQRVCCQAKVRQTPATGRYCQKGKEKSTKDLRKEPWRKSFMSRLNEAELMIEPQAKNTWLQSQLRLFSKRRRTIIFGDTDMKRGCIISSTWGEGTPRWSLLKPSCVTRHCPPHCGVLEARNWQSSSLQDTEYPS